jgi:hypothetical protein
MYCLVYYLFIFFVYNCLFLIAIVRCQRLWESSRTWLPRLWAAASRRARQVTLDLFQYDFSLLYTQTACNNWFPKLSYFRIGFLWLIVMLSPVVLSHRTSLSIFMMLSLTCVECWECWSSICHDVRWPWWDSMLWFEQGLEWWRQLEFVRWCGLSCSNLLRTES